MTKFTLQKIKENIAIARKQAGLTQDDMAKELNISQPAYSYYESGDKPIPLNKIKLISEILSIPMNSLIGDIPTDTDDKESIESVNENLHHIASTLDKMYTLLEKHLKI